VQFPIIIGLRRSRFLDGALMATTCIGLVAIALVPWLPPISFILGIATVFVAILVARALTPRIRALRIDHDGAIGCRSIGKSEFSPARLLPGATAHPWLTVLRLAHEQVVYRLVIAQDSATPEELRRLRVWLRWRAEVSGGAGDP
jgi:toxin CptA